MSVGRDASAERRRTRERTLIHEGEALWRAKQRHNWISRLQDQREARDMLSAYNPWGRPGCGAPMSDDLRKKKVPQLYGPLIPALDMGRPGGGAPLRTKSGRLQTVLRVDPTLRFQEPSKNMVEIEQRYRASPTQQNEYKNELDAMVIEKKKTQSDARKNCTQEIRRMHGAAAPWGRPGPGGAPWRAHRSNQRRFMQSMGWSSDPNLIVSTREEAAGGEAPPPQLHSSNCTTLPKIHQHHQGQELAPLMKQRQFDLLHSRHPLSTTDVTRFQVPGIQVARCDEDEDLVQTLRRQVIYKQKKLEELRRREVESCQKHFETWNKFWGRPGGGAPSGRPPPPKFDVNDFFGSETNAEDELRLEPIK